MISFNIEMNHLREIYAAVGGSLKDQGLTNLHFGGVLHLIADVTTKMLSRDNNCCLCVDCFMANLAPTEQSIVRKHARTQDISPSKFPKLIYDEDEQC